MCNSACLAAIYDFIDKYWNEWINKKSKCSFRRKCTFNDFYIICALKQNLNYKLLVNIIDHKDLFTTANADINLISMKLQEHAC